MRVGSAAKARWILESEGSRGVRSLNYDTVGLTPRRDQGSSSRRNRAVADNLSPPLLSKVQWQHSDDIGRQIRFTSRRAFIPDAPAALRGNEDSRAYSIRALESKVSLKLRP